MTAPPGLLISAPSSGAGKTTVMLGLLRARKYLGNAQVIAKLRDDMTKLEEASDHSAFCTCVPQELLRQRALLSTAVC